MAMTRRPSFSAVALALLVASSLGAQPTSFTWPTSTPSKVGLNPAVLDSLDAVTSAETDRTQRIVTAEQDRARILGETAGSASARLLAEIDAYEQAVEAGRTADAEAIALAVDEAIDVLRIDGVAIGGDVARRIDAAKTHRARVVEEVRGDRETFERLLPEYEQHPRLVLNRLWEATRERIFTGDVETFYTAPGRLELQLNRDPEIQKERQQEQLRGQREATGGRGSR